MKILEPGHTYELPHLESGGHEILTFIKRSSDAVDYGDDQHPGTNSQEVIRALIDRTLFLDSILPAVETQDAAYYLRMALFCYEARAYRRKHQHLNRTSSVNEFSERYEDIPFNEQDIEMLPIGDDGHIIIKPLSERPIYFPKDPLAKTMGDMVSPKQLGYIRALSRDVDVEPDEECQAVMKCNTDSLSKEAASCLIEHLKRRKVGK